MDMKNKATVSQAQESIAKKIANSILKEHDIINLYSNDCQLSQEDSINPSHYITDTIETIQVIEAFTKDLKGIEAVCTGNVIKYICRWNKKNGLEDLRKARWYIDFLIDRVEARNEE